MSAYPPRPWLEKAGERADAASSRCVSWGDLTENDRSRFLQSSLANGCGAKASVGVGRFRVRFRPPQFRFKASCDLHDFGYTVGGDALRRRWVDAQFLGAMVADAAVLPWWRRPLHFLAAAVFFQAVRIGGGRHFVHRAEPLTLEQVREMIAAQLEEDYGDLADLGSL